MVGKKYKFVTSENIDISFVRFAYFWFSIVTCESDKIERIQNTKGLFYVSFNKLPSPVSHFHSSDSEYIRPSGEERKSTIDKEFTKVKEVVVPSNI